MKITGSARPKAIFEIRGPAERRAGLWTLGTNVSEGMKREGRERELEGGFMGKDGREGKGSLLRTNESVD